MTDTVPLISVIVPVYKVEQYLERCVESLLSQSYRNTEIILVDDGSPDACPGICDAFAERDPRVLVIHKQNGGLSDARNAGIATASGEYISFIDSDDWVEPDFLSVLYDLIEKYHCDAAGCAFCRNDEMPEKNPDAVIEYGNHEAMSALIDNKIKQVVWNKLYHRSVAADIPFEKGKYHEDEYWSYQAFSRMKIYAETARVAYHYFYRPDSIMGVSYSKKRLDAIDAKCIRQEFLSRHYPDLAAKGKIKLLFSCLYQGQLAAAGLSGDEKKEVFGYLKKVYSEHYPTVKECGSVSLSHRIWLLSGKVAFRVTCRIRNLLNIGV